MFPISVDSDLRQTDIGYEKFKKDLFVWTLRSRRIVTLCLNCTAWNFLTYYLLTWSCCNHFDPLSLCSPWL